jgi:hypothetical protein
MSWDPLVEDAFSPNLIFARRPNDEQRGFELLAHFRQRGTGWTDAKRQITAFLRSKTIDGAHVNQQVTNAERHLRPWLSD